MSKLVVLTALLKRHSIVERHIQADRKDYLKASHSKNNEDKAEAKLKPISKDIGLKK